MFHDICCFLLWFSHKKLSYRIKNYIYFFSVIERIYEYENIFNFST